MAGQKCEVQTDAEFGIFLRQFYGFVKSDFVHHQARACQNAVAMRANDGLIDGMRTPEIIRVDDEAADGIRAFHNLQFLTQR